MPKTTEDQTATRSIWILKSMGLFNSYIQETFIEIELLEKKNVVV